MRCRSRAESWAERQKYRSIDGRLQRKRMTEWKNAEKKNAVECSVEGRERWWLACVFLWGGGGLFWTRNDGQTQASHLSLSLTHWEEEVNTHPFTAHTLLTQNHLRLEIYFFLFNAHALSVDKMCESGEEHSRVISHNSSRVEGARRKWIRQNVTDTRVCLMHQVYWTPTAESHTQFITNVPTSHYVHSRQDSTDQFSTCIPFTNSTRITLWSTCIIQSTPNSPHTYSYESFFSRTSSKSSQNFTTLTQKAYATHHTPTLIWKMLCGIPE